MYSCCKNAFACEVIKWHCFEGCVGNVEIAQYLASSQGCRREGRGNQGEGSTRSSREGCHLFYNAHVHR